MLGCDRDIGIAQWGHWGVIGMGMLGRDRDSRTAQWGHQGMTGTLRYEDGDMGRHGDRSTRTAQWADQGHRDSLMEHWDFTGTRTITPVWDRNTGTAQQGHQNVTGSGTRDEPMESPGGDGVTV